MELEQRYHQAFERMEQTAYRRKEEKRYTALGYTSNLDLLCDFQVEQLNKLLAEHLLGGCLTDMKAAEKIDTIQELLQTIVYYCSRGIGGEVDVRNCELVESSFSFEYGMGGTGVQAAMALAGIGCPSIVHLTDDSQEVCHILDSPFIYTVSENGVLVHTGEIRQTKEQEIHFIIQFKKGDCIRLGNQAVEIPCSNRLILTKITVNELVPFSEEYFRWVEEHAESVSSNVLSSFNGILDKNILSKRLKYVEEHAERYRQRNGEGILFFEDAHYHDSEIRKLCRELIYPCVDIVSLNEEELKHTLEEMNVLDKQAPKININDIFSCIEGAGYISRTFGIKKGVIVHTKDYSMYVGRPLQADIESGLMYGNMLATAKAKNGSYGTRQQVGETLTFELSEKGLENYRKVVQSTYADAVTLVPSRYIDKPQYTIGLGDSFVGGVQMCF